MARRNPATEYGRHEQTEHEEGEQENHSLDQKVNSFMTQLGFQLQDAAKEIAQAADWRRSLPDGTLDWEQTAPLRNGNQPSWLRDGEDGTTMNIYRAFEATARAEGAGEETRGSAAEHMARFMTNPLTWQAKAMARSQESFQVTQESTEALQQRLTEQIAGIEKKLNSGLANGDPEEYREGANQATGLQQFYKNAGETGIASQEAHDFSRAVIEADEKTDPEPTEEWNHYYTRETAARARDATNRIIEGDPGAYEALWNDVKGRFHFQEAQRRGEDPETTLRDMVQHGLDEFTTRVQHEDPQIMKRLMEGTYGGARPGEEELENYTIRNTTYRAMREADGILKGESEYVGPRIKEYMEDRLSDILTSNLARMTENFQKEHATVEVLTEDVPTKVFFLKRFIGAKSYEEKQVKEVTLNGAPLQDPEEHMRLTGMARAIEEEALRLQGIAEKIPYGEPHGKLFNATDLKAKDILQKTRKETLDNYDGIQWGDPG